jgi:hypothetical protein
VGVQRCPGKEEANPVNRVPNHTKRLVHMTIMTVGNRRGYGAAKPLSPESLRNIDEDWRAATYLCVGRIYLHDNARRRLP